MEEYVKILEDDTLTDVVLLVEGEHFPTHSVVLAGLEWWGGLYSRGFGDI